MREKTRERSLAATPRLSTRSRTPGGDAADTKAELELCDHDHLCGLLGRYCACGLLGHENSGEQLGCVLSGRLIAGGGVIGHGRKGRVFPARTSSSYA